jgi:hypothetical protein
MTPEIFLNLFWVAIAIWSLTAATRGELRRDLHRIRMSAVLSVVCFLALLFPIVSITDDIHCDSQLGEEASATRRMRSVVEQSCAAPVAVLTNFAGADSLTPQLSPLFVVRTADERPPSRLLSPRLSPRAPPAV